jgi:transposase-like protein
MDTGGASNPGGNGVHIPGEHPTQSSAVPSKEGAPVESPSAGASAGAPSTLTPKQHAVLACLEEGLTKTGACRAAKIARQSLYNWLHAVGTDGHPTPNAVEFRKQFDHAYQAGTDALIDEAKRRAVEGWDEEREFGTVRKYDSTLLMFLIKQRDPSFREKYEVTGANGSPLHPAKVTLDVNHTYAEALKSLTDAELEAHNAIASKLLARSSGSLPLGPN